MRASDIPMLASEHACLSVWEEGPSMFAWKAPDGKMRLAYRAQEHVLESCVAVRRRRNATNALQCTATSALRAHGGIKIKE